MDPPQTKKQGQKDSKEKRNGFKGLHSGKGVRAITENQSRSKKSKKNTFFNEKIDPPCAAGEFAGTKWILSRIVRT